MTEKTLDENKPETIAFAAWLEAFEKDKRLVGSSDQSDASAVHSIKRYIDNGGNLWEVAQTYTDRVVIRSGRTANGDLTVNWNPWQTLHNVVISRPV